MNPLILVLRIWNSTEIVQLVVRKPDKDTTRGFHRIPRPPSTPLASTATDSHPFHTFWAILASSHPEHLVSCRKIIPDLSLSILLLRRRFLRALLQPLIFQVVICIKRVLIGGRKGYIYCWILPWSHRLFTYCYDSLDIARSTSFIFLHIFLTFSDFEGFSHYSEGACVFSLNDGFLQERHLLRGD